MANKWVSGASGSIYVNTEHVTAVESTSSGVFLYLSGGTRIRLHDERSAEEIARELLGPSDVE